MRRSVRAREKEQQVLLLETELSFARQEKEAFSSQCLSLAAAVEDLKRKVHQLEEQQKQEAQNNQLEEAAEALAEMELMLQTAAEEARQLKEEKEELLKRIEELEGASRTDS
ncbi:hypothetical protein EPH_0029180 [Eimeria praecox]|uniref:Uncharacterized protein n=1 Tax=Eimeria praecox TaxID=51316 RepID=U6G143_9EIME|nr:hypothetical protein EPH_0029180 [Eimeria praecox]